MRYRTASIHAAPLVAACLALSTADAVAQRPLRDLVDLSLEQLSNTRVVSVSRRSEPLSEAPAAIFVITGDDIRRSGARTLPEALRLAPNLHIARADANQYAISARGFNGVLANKMLVMIDGRIAYSPLFSGVFWEAQDVLLEDVARIEVISGPGATHYGTNAVNGVINVFTRSAGDTQGALASLGAGNRQRDAVLRYGGRLASGAAWRAYGKLSDRGNTVLTNGAPVRDSADSAQAGFRLDWADTSRALTLQGDGYSSDIDQAPAGRKLAGFNLRGSLNQQLSGTSRLRFQVYFDRTERDQPGAIREELDTAHAELQHESLLAKRHRIIWGLDYRRSDDKVENLNPAVLGFRPASRTLDWASAFVQDEISLAENLVLTLGVRGERNDYTGNEWLPQVRLAWRPDARRLVWGALSRAVRAPSRVDREFVNPANPPFFLAGGPSFQSEVVNALQLGYRAQVSEQLSYSVTAFRNDYDRLRTTELRPGGRVFENNIDGHVDGLEAWGSYRVNNRWRLSAGQTFQSRKLALKPGSTDATGVAALGNDPGHWTTLRSSWDVADAHELDVMVRRVGSLPSGPVPAYTAVDLRWGWKLLPGLDLSLVGQNAFDRRHPEWGPPANRAEMERSLYLKIVWRP